MKINISKATFSSIVGIGQKVKKAAKESGEKYLELNRGVNAVTEIDLSEVMNQIDFNSKEFQIYAPNLGIESFRKAIVREYFPSHQSDGYENNISITPGGMPALDIVLQTLNVDYSISLLSDEVKNVKFYTRTNEERCTGNSIYREKTSFFSDDEITIKNKTTTTLELLLKNKQLLWPKKPINFIGFLIKSCHIQFLIHITQRLLCCGICVTCQIET